MVSQKEMILTAAVTSEYNKGPNFFGSNLAISIRLQNFNKKKRINEEISPEKKRPGHRRAISENQRAAIWAKPWWTQSAQARRLRP